MKKGLIIGLSACAAAAAIALAVVGTSGTKKHEEIDLSSHTTSAAEAVKETMAATTAARTEAVPAAEDTGSADKVSAAVDTYIKNNIRIGFPVVSGLADEAKLNELNKHLKSNALSIIKAYGIDQSKDTADISCEIISADRSRIVAVYRGYVDMARSAHPSNVFYTNTVDVPTVKDIGFGKYADAYTMAGYVMSDDLELTDSNAVTEEEFKALRDELGFEYFYEVLRNADFPYTDVFPESFSYTDSDAIYFSLPVSHAAGDYVIAVFRPEGK